jgi:hypothetical protein
MPGSWVYVMTNRQLRGAGIVTNPLNPGKRWYHVSDVPQFLIGILTLGALALYTWYSSEQVDKSEVANNIARQALGEANKPYVMFSSLAPHLTKDLNGVHKQAGLTFTNYGNTPALNPVFYMCTPLTKETSGAPSYKCDLAEPPAKANPLGPKQTTTFSGPIISEADLEASKDERKFIYVFGFLKYDDKIDVDPYGNTKRRVTSFCQRIVQPTMTIVDNNPVAKQSPGLASSQSSPSGSSVAQPGGETQASSANLMEPQFIGFGCQGFNYCLDDDCPELPK